MEAMEVSEKVVRQALVECGGIKERAVEMLLSHAHVSRV